MAQTKTELARFALLLEHVHDSALNISDRRDSEGRVHKRCFTGAALVSWIAAAQNGSRSEALALSQKLLELKALRLSVAGGEEDEPTTPMELRDSADTWYVLRGASTLLMDHMKHVSDNGAQWIALLQRMLQGACALPIEHRVIGNVCLNGSGSALVDWLLKADMASTRDEAVALGQHLFDLGYFVTSGDESGMLVGILHDDPTEYYQVAPSALDAVGSSENGSAATEDSAIVPEENSASAPEDHDGQAPTLTTEIPELHSSAAEETRRARRPSVSRKHTHRKPRVKVANSNVERPSDALRRMLAQKSVDTSASEGGSDSEGAASEQGSPATLRLKLHTRQTSRDDRGPLQKTPTRHHLSTSGHKMLMRSTPETPSSVVRRNSDEGEELDAKKAAKWWAKKDKANKEEEKRRKKEREERLKEEKKREKEERKRNKHSLSLLEKQSSVGEISDSSDGPKLFGLELRLNGYALIVREHSICIFTDKRAGLDVVGIFRISANGVDLNVVKDLLNQGERPSINKYGSDPHIVTGLLKAWLRALPTPLVSPFERWSAISDQVMPAKQVREAEEAVLAMDHSSAASLDYLIRFCSHVIAHQEQNKMTKSNMSALIGPNIMRRLSPSPMSMLKDVRDSNTICLLLFDHYDEIFAKVQYEGKDSVAFRSVDSPVDITPIVESPKPSEQPQFVRASQSVIMRQLMGGAPLPVVSAGASPSAEKTRGPSTPHGTLVTLQFDDATYDQFNVQHARLQSPQCASGWLMLGYADKTKVGLQAQGSGGAEELVKHLRDEEVQYVLLRVKHVGTSFTKLRNVFVVWTGPEVSSVVKGQKRSHAGEVRALLQPIHVELSAIGRSNFTDDTIFDLCAPNAGTHVID